MIITLNFVVCILMFNSRQNWAGDCHQNGRNENKGNSSRLGKCSTTIHVDLGKEQLLSIKLQQYQSSLFATEIPAYFYQEETWKS